MPDWPFSATSIPEVSVGRRSRALRISVFLYTLKGMPFEWQGRTYEVVKVHDITRASTSRWAPGQRNEQVVHRGYVVASVHVKVDGRLVVARLEATANYVTFPEGWEWDKVLLYLGRNVSYDFVAGTLG